LHFPPGHRNRSGDESNAVAGWQDGSSEIFETAPGPALLVLQLNVMHAQQNVQKFKNFPTLPVDDTRTASGFCRS
jgi:hypothetical protein